MKPVTITISNTLVRLSSIYTGFFNNFMTALGNSKSNKSNIRNSVSIMYFANNQPNSAEKHRMRATITDCTSPIFRNQFNGTKERQYL